MKVITDFFTSIGEERAPDRYPQRPRQYYGYILPGCTKKDRIEFEPDSLGSMYNSLDRHLRDMESPIRYVLTILSFKIVNIHHKFA
jgi:hypothetical protein